MHSFTQKILIVLLKNPIIIIEDILTSIENMSMRSLSNLAISHGIKVLNKISSDNLKNILSDHLFKLLLIYIQLLKDVYR